MKWILLLSGTLTCTMFYATLAPQAAMIATFGVPLEGEAADVVVRSWGTLITLVGAMLIYGAFHPPARPLVLTIAGLSKVCFILLVLSHGTRFLPHQAGVAVVTDSIMVLLFIGYLIGARRREGPGPAGAPGQRSG